MEAPGSSEVFRMEVAVGDCIDDAEDAAGVADTGFPEETGSALGIRVDGGFLHCAGATADSGATTDSGATAHSGATGGTGTTGRGEALTAAPAMEPLPAVGLAAPGATADWVISLSICS
eukprot:jgi/Mesvir1/21301/Mv24066-RA.1